MTREISFDVEVPGTPEEVWDAIATGPGISSWFVPSEIDGDRMRQHHGTDMDWTTEIAAFEPPRRLMLADEFAPSPEAAPRRLATEFLVEARSGGTCVVRVVTSGLGDGPDWDRAIESFSQGWTGALDDLRLYLTHFAPKHAAGFAISAPLEGSWAQLSAALGIEGAAPGERVQARGLGGTVARASDDHVALLLDAPAPGIAYLGAGGPGPDVQAFVRAKLFGDDAPELAAREEAAWERWLAQAGATPAPAEAPRRA
jgi:uncharacterized protein YndB with AHSA1/START domain